MQCDDEDQICRGRLVLPQGLKELIWISGHVSLSRLLYSCLSRFPLGHKLIQSRIWLNFAELLFTRVLDTEAAQLVKENYSDLIHVPRIDFFTRLLHVVKCRSKENVLLKKSVTTRAAKDWKTALMLFT